MGDGVWVTSWVTVWMTLCCWRYAGDGLSDGVGHCVGDAKQMLISVTPFHDVAQVLLSMTLSMTTFP